MNGRGQSKELIRLATIPRGRSGEEFRISVDEFHPEDGEPKQYVSARVWYKTDSGELRPGKTGCTVRRAELAQAIEALQRAQRILSGKEQPGRHPQAVLSDQGETTEDDRSMF